MVRVRAADFLVRARPEQARQQAEDAIRELHEARARARAAFTSAMALCGAVDPQRGRDLREPVGVEQIVRDGGLIELHPSVVGVAG